MIAPSERNNAKRDFSVAFLGWGALITTIGLAAINKLNGMGLFFSTELGARETGMFCPDVTSVSLLAGGLTFLAAGVAGLVEGAKK